MNATHLKESDNCLQRFRNQPFDNNLKPSSTLKYSFTLSFSFSVIHTVHLVFSLLLKPFEEHCLIHTSQMCFIRPDLLNWTVGS